jgi:hypothetical protein
MNRAMSQRQRLGLVSVLGLLLLGLLVSLIPLGGAVGVVLFVVVLTLVGVLFFRFNPYGDIWDEAEHVSINPWLFAALIVGAAIAFFALRFALLEAL